MLVIPAISSRYRSIASSSNGTKLAAVVWGGGYIYTSTDSGATWTQATSAGSRDWISIASSSDGTKLAAVVYNGYVYTSTDSGASWTQQSSAGSRRWWSIASSSDGTKLAAVVYNGYIYTSTDSGATWTAHVQWSSVPIPYPGLAPLLAHAPPADAKEIMRRLPSDAVERLHMSLKCLWPRVPAAIVSHIARLVAIDL